MDVFEDSEDVLIPGSDEETQNKCNAAADTLNALTLRLTKAYEVIHKQQNQLENLCADLLAFTQSRTVLQDEDMGRAEVVVGEQSQILSDNERLRKENSELREYLSQLLARQQKRQQQTKTTESKPPEPDQAWEQEITRVLAFMDKSGITQHALAKLVGCSQGTLSVWLKRKYTGDVVRVTSRIHSALDILETKTPKELRECNTPLQPSGQQRKNFTREQTEIMEAIALETPTPHCTVVDQLAIVFQREQRHVLKWFSNWRNRKQPRCLSTPPTPIVPFQGISSPLLHFPQL